MLFKFLAVVALSLSISLYGYQNLPSAKTKGAALRVLLESLKIPARLPLEQFELGFSYICYIILGAPLAIVLRPLRWLPGLAYLIVLALNVAITFKNNPVSTWDASLLLERFPVFQQIISRVAIGFAYLALLGVSEKIRTVVKKVEVEKKEVEEKKEK